MIMEENEVKNDNIVEDDMSILALEEIERMHYVFNISKLDKEGYWQIMVFDFKILRFKNIYDGPIIFYKNQIFDSLDTPPWSNEKIEDVRTEINVINKDGTPLCVCVFIRDLN